jgi:hypothetical protein
MGANAQTSVPAFTAGQVLTAAQVTQINTGIPVFASSTERDAAFGGSGEKTLAEGQMAYLEDTNVTQDYDGSSWAVVGGAGPGLVLLDQTTVGSAVSSVAVSSVFSATYDNYMIVVRGIIGSSNTLLGMRFGASATSYYGAKRNITQAGGLSTDTVSNLAQFYIGNVLTSQTSMSSVCYVSSPYQTDETAAHGTFARAGFGGYFQAAQTVSASYTDFTILPASGTITGGTISTYGLVNL